MRQTLLIILAVVLLVSKGFAQYNSPSLIGSWKLIKSEALEAIKGSDTYASMPQNQRKAFEAQSDLLMQVSRYEFKQNNELIYMDVELSTVGVFLPVERKAKWELKEDILTIKEVDRPYERQMKVSFLDDSTLVVQLIVDGRVSDGRLVFKAMK